MNSTTHNLGHLQLKSGHCIKAWFGKLTINFIVKYKSSDPTWNNMQNACVNWWWPSDPMGLFEYLSANAPAQFFFWRLIGDDHLAIWLNEIKTSRGLQLLTSVKQQEQKN